MRKIIGYSIIVFGVALGIYVGFWIFFIGGVLAIIDSIKATPTDAFGIALGIGRIVFASFFGWMIVLVTGSLGLFVAAGEKPQSKMRPSADNRIHRGNRFGIRS